MTHLCDWCERPIAGPQLVTLKTDHATPENASQGWLGRYHESCFSDGVLPALREIGSRHASALRHARVGEGR